CSGARGRWRGDRSHVPHVRSEGSLVRGRARCRPGHPGRGGSNTAGEGHGSAAAARHSRSDGAGEGGAEAARAASIGEARTEGSISGPSTKPTRRATREIESADDVGRVLVLPIHEVVNRDPVRIVHPGNRVPIELPENRVWRKQTAKRSNLEFLEHEI